MARECEVRCVGDDQQLVSATHSISLCLSVGGDNFAGLHTIIIAKSVCSLCGGPIFTGCRDGLGRRTAEFISELYQSISQSFVAELSCSKLFSNPSRDIHVTQLSIFINF